MRPALRKLLPGLFLSTAFPAAAQLPIVDIAAVPVAGQVEVRVRPDAGFNGLFSSLVFTLRWPEADGASLGSVVQQSPVSLYCGVSRSGSEQVDGGYRYQVFVGFGNIPLVDLDTAWVAGQEVVLCRVNVNGSSVFRVADDPWTAAANGSFYVSLNGEDRTGSIYDPISTGWSSLPDGQVPVRIAPNPTIGPLRVTVNETVGPTVALELMDATGRSVWAVSRPSGIGAFQEEIDLGAFAGGIFVLQVTAGHRRTFHRVVLEGR